MCPTSIKPLKMTPSTSSDVSFKSRYTVCPVRYNKTSVNNIIKQEMNYSLCGLFAFFITVAV